MEVTFIRHGEARLDMNNYERTLTENEKDQIESLANEWNDYGVTFEKIVASPYLRTMETAEVMGDILNCQIDYQSMWSEYNRSKSFEIDKRFTK